jgi:(2Fe-2S) ferredoxin
MEHNKMSFKAPPFEKFIFVCEKKREDGKACCGPVAVGMNYVDRLKEQVKKRGLSRKIRITRTGCFDVCAQGPNFLVFPDGKWYRNVDEKMLDHIISQELK